MSKRNLYAELIASLKEIDEFQSKSEDELSEIACNVVRDIRQEIRDEKELVASIKLDDPGSEWVEWDTIELNELNKSLITATEVLYGIKNDKRMNLPIEFGDVQDVIDNGAVKHGRDSWLQPGVFLFNKIIKTVYPHFYILI